ncbi:MAG: ATP-binding protein [Gemmatimonadaceae bacterium]
MRTLRPALSFRSRILLIVVTGAVMPLALIGFWLTRTSARSGEELLRNRLRQALDQVVQDVGSRWLAQRSELISLTEHPALQQALAGGAQSGAEGGPMGRTPSAFADRVAQLGPSLEHVTVRDARGQTRWILDRSVEDEPPGSVREPLLGVEFPIHNRISGDRLGTLAARIHANRTLGQHPTLLAAGAVLGAFDRHTGAPLLPLPLDRTMLVRERFPWGGDEWLSERRVLADPPLELIGAAPLGPFIRPFERAARRGVWILLVVSGVSVAVAVMLTGRMTRKLERLTTATEAVAGGDLDRTVDSTGKDEAGRLARSFNYMTASLRRTLGELSQREALAAVGEFASGLAHEVRNPLTAIRVDLQMVQEQLPPGSRALALQDRALAEIQRLDRTVSGALSVARSGRIALVPIDPRVPLRAAMDNADPVFRARGASVSFVDNGAQEVRINGDAAALQQLFLNLLLNAAQALGEGVGGSATISVQRRNGHVVMSVSDNGSGIPEEAREKVFEPFYSTRPQGTGLGLAIARRIVAAHQGEIRIESAPRVGTAVYVTMRALT